MEIIHTFIDCKANIQTLNQSEDTSLIYASSHGLLDVCKLLLSTNSTMNNNNNNTRRIKIKKKGNGEGEGEQEEETFEEPFDMINHANSLGKTALYNAYENSHGDVAEFLLQGCSENKY